MGKYMRNFKCNNYTSIFKDHAHPLLLGSSSLQYTYFQSPLPYFHMVFKKGRFQVPGAVSPAIQPWLVLVQV